MEPILCWLNIAPPRDKLSRASFSAVTAKCLLGVSTCPPGGVCKGQRPPPPAISFPALPTAPRTAPRRGQKLDATLASYVCLRPTPCSTHGQVFQLLLQRVPGSPARLDCRVHTGLTPPAWKSQFPPHLSPCCLCCFSHFVQDTMRAGMAGPKGPVPTRWTQAGGRKQVGEGTCGPLASGLSDRLPRPCCKGWGGGVPGVAGALGCPHG